MPYLKALPIVFAVALLALNIAGKCGELFAPSLVNEHPLILILLNANNVHLALTATSIPEFQYYIVGGLRRFVEDSVYFSFGRVFGELAIAWARTSLPGAVKVFAKFETWLTRAAPLVLSVYPSGPLWVLAGATKVPVKVFCGVTLIGIGFRLWLIRSIGGVLSSQVNTLLELVKEYQHMLMVPTTIIAILGLIPAVLPIIKLPQGLLKKTD
mmetsp:Transcript_35820/g.78206  ORF Transcript_35820/g.78206 Transcript_35820/m.78206 type:complete len:212 (+) Transcript_35820:150-785(+)